MGTKIFTDRYFAVILPNNYKAFEMRDSFLIWTQTDFHKIVGNTLDALLKSGAANLCLIESNCSNVLNAINNTGVNLQISNILLPPPRNHLCNLSLIHI